MNWRSRLRCVPSPSSCCASPRRRSCSDMLSSVQSAACASTGSGTPQQTSDGAVAQNCDGRPSPPGGAAGTAAARARGATAPTTRLDSSNALGSRSGHSSERRQQQHQPRRRRPGATRVRHSAEPAGRTAVWQAAGGLSGMVLAASQRRTGPALQGEHPPGQPCAAGAWSACQRSCLFRWLFTAAKSSAEGHAGPNAPGGPGNSSFCASRAVLLT